MAGKWKERARQLKADARAVLLVCRDPRVPWHVRLLAAAVVAYAFSPIDLIPDFIPVLGYLDDLILIPLGVALVIRLIPAQVWNECREKARLEAGAGKPVSRAGAVLVVAVWLLVIALAVAWGSEAFRAFFRDGF